MALLFKHFIHNTFNWRSYLSFIILPIVLFIFAMVCMSFKPGSENEPKIELAPERYERTHAFFR